MFAIFIQVLLLFSETESSPAGGFAKFYNDYLNVPGLEAWKFFNLAVFVVILIYILKRPLGAAFKAKRDAIRAELIKAEEEKQAALKRLGEVEAKLGSLETEVQTILARANDEAARDKAEVAAQTESEIKRLRDQISAEIARLSSQSKADLRKFSAEESIRLAEAKLRQQVDAVKDSNLVLANIKAIGGLN